MKRIGKQKIQKMKKIVILGILACMILSACQQDNELVEIEAIEKNAVTPPGKNSAIPDLTFVDGTPVEYTVEDIEVIVVYEAGATEAEKAQVRANNTTIYGTIQVTPCPLNPNAEIWNYRTLIIHNWEDAPYQELNHRATDPIEDEDIVRKAALRQIDYKRYRINDPTVICD